MAISRLADAYDAEILLTMRLEHIVRAVFGEPWLITAESHAALVEIVRAHVLDPRALARENGSDACGNAVEVPQMQVEDGVAIIPIAGVIGRKLTGYERGGGLVDSLDIIRDIRTAEADPEVKALVFDVDSPGGMVAGTQETADAIRAVQKPTMAFASGSMCSAAYWMGSAADEVWASPSAVIGSVGAYMPVYDTSRLAEASGYKVDVFRSGRFKGMGIPGTSLDADQRALLQSQIDDIGSQFRMWVCSRRHGNIADSDMEGQTFIAREAQNRSFVDHVTADWRGQFPNSACRANQG